jgi:hypothetical protein
MMVIEYELIVELEDGDRITFSGAVKKPEDLKNILVHAAFDLEGILNKKNTP